MMMETIRNMVQMRFPSKAANIGLPGLPLLFLLLSRFYSDELDEIKIAASEAVSNAVINGYKGREGEITVICRL